MIKLIIFDLWDTLAYKEGSTFQEVLRQKLAPHQSRVEFNEVLEATIQLKEWESMEQMYINLLNYLKINFSKEILDDLINITKNALDQICFFEESLEVLSELKQKYKLALISNTFNFSTNKLGNDFQQYFECLCFSYKMHLTKPNPKIFRYVLDKFGVKPEEVVMVGDSLRVDMKPAEKLGIKTIWINKKNLIPPEPRDSIKSLRKIEDYMKQKGWV